METIVIRTKEDLKENMCKALSLFPDCTLSLNKLYVTSSRINDDNVVISLCHDANIYLSGIVNYKNYSEIEDFVKNNIIEHVKIPDENYYEILNINVKIPEELTEDDLDDDTYNEKFDPEGYYNIDFKEDYLTKHNRIRMLQTPIPIANVNDALKFFARFIMNDKCNKLIISFSVSIPSIDHIFIIDLVFDKFYIYGRTMMSFTISRPDCYPGFSIKDPSDHITEFDKNNKNLVEKLMEDAKDYMFMCFKRCSFISDQDIEIDVYSNIKLI